MKTFDELLEDYKQAKGLDTWDALARDIGVTEEGLRKIRRGKGGLKEKTIKAIMEATGVSAPVVVACWQAEHAKDPAVRESWKRWAATLATTLALATPLPTQVVDSGMQPLELARSVYYVN